jgi:O-antigen/teichoic acid export membrane protein
VTATGAVPLLIGLVVQAGTTYVFLVLAGRTLGATGFGALSSLYILLTSLATGLFQPLEQEVARRRGAERAEGTWDDSLFRRALAQGLVTVCLAVAVLLLALPVTLRVLGEDPQLVASVCVGLAGYAGWFATRGELSGARQLTRYGVQLALEGTLRLVALLTVVVVGEPSPATCGWLLALSPWATLLVTSLRWRPASERPVRRTPGLARRLYLLIASALAAQLLINAGPLVVNLLATPAERAQAGLFLAVLVVVRVPVFLFSAIQPSFLPALAERAAAGRRRSFVRLLGQVLSALIAVVALMCALAATIGPAVVEWLFDFDEQLPIGVYLLLSLSVGLFLVATVLAQALIGLGLHAWVMIGWLSGLLGLAVGSLRGDSVVEQATRGLLVGALVTTVVLGLRLTQRIRAWVSTSPA